jgi:hypothetical protein
MATANLLIGTNHAALSATVTASSTATGYSAYNVLTGAKQSTWKSNGADTEHWIQFEFATAQIIDHAFIGRADITSDLRGVSFVYNIQCSDNGTDWLIPDWHESASLTYATAGANSASGEDYIAIEADSAAHVYWRLLITFNAAATAEISKLYLGKALDLYRDPFDVITKRESLSAEQRRGLYEILLSYSGVNYSLAQDLIEQVQLVHDWHPVVLFTAAQHGILYTKYCIFCEVLEINTPQEIISQNDITLRLREIL